VEKKGSVFRSNVFCFPHTYRRRKMRCENFFPIKNKI